MMSLTQMASAVTAVLVIMGVGWGFDKTYIDKDEFAPVAEESEKHVASEDFEKYIQQQQLADDREYVRKLKQDLRDLSLALAEHPDDLYLQNALAEVLDDLCDLRPEDRLCEGADE